MIVPPLAASACDYLPTPARATVDGAQIEIEAKWVAGSTPGAPLEIEVTLHASDLSTVTFDQDVKMLDAEIVRANGGRTLVFLARVAPDKRVIEGAVTFKTDHRGVPSTAHVKIHVSTYERELGASPQAWLSEQ